MACDLADDVLVEELVDLVWLGKLGEAHLLGAGQLLFDDLVAQLDALIADVDAGAGDQLLDLLLRLAAEAALEQFRPFVLRQGESSLVGDGLELTADSTESTTPYSMASSGPSQ